MKFEKTTGKAEKKASAVYGTLVYFFSSHSYIDFIVMVLFRPPRFMSLKDRRSLTHFQFPLSVIYLVHPPCFMFHWSVLTSCTSSFLFCSFLFGLLSIFSLVFCFSNLSQSPFLLFIIYVFSLTFCSPCCMFHEYIPLPFISSSVFYIFLRFFFSLSLFASCFAKLSKHDTFSISSVISLFSVSPKYHSLSLSNFVFLCIFFNRSAILRASVRGAFVLFVHPCAVSWCCFNLFSFKFRFDSTLFLLVSVWPVFSIPVYFRFL